MVTKRIKLSKPIEGSHIIMLVYSNCDGQRPAIVFSDGRSESVNPNLEAVAWRAWPPIYSSKLLIAPVVTNGRTVTGIDPQGRAVWAVTSLPNDRAIMGNLKRGASEWRAMMLAQQSIDSLKTKAAAVQDGKIAILPPNPTGPAMDLLQRIGMLKRSVVLTPEQLVDPGSLTPARFPVLLYAGGEEYVHTVRTPGDAADALVDYVKTGGALLVLSPGATFPFFFATGPGFRKGDPLVERLGLPLDFTVESKQPEKLRVRLFTDQKVLSGVPSEFPYPPGDIRLRTINTSRLPAGVKYIPIYTVFGESGKSYGDAAGLVEYPSGGRVLFIFGTLMADPTHGPAIVQAAIKYLIESGV
jgi:hypothetical protein